MAPKEHQRHFFGCTETFVDKKPSQLRIFGSGWIDPSSCDQVYCKKDNIDKLMHTAKYHGHDGDFQRIRSKLRADLGYTFGNILTLFSIDRFQKLEPFLVDVSSIRAGMATLQQDLDSCCDQQNSHKVPPQLSLEKFFVHSKAKQQD